MRTVKDLIDASQEGIEKNKKLALEILEDPMYQSRMRVIYTLANYLVEHPENAEQAALTLVQEMIKKHETKLLLLLLAQGVQYSLEVAYDRKPDLPLE